jgi:toxin ParE1/3/4
MLPVKRHPLVRADIQSAYNWYETKQLGLGGEFIEDFRRAYHRLQQSPAFYSVRFSEVRRLNLGRFPYGIFYVLETDHIQMLGVLHASRDTENVLANRRTL